MGSIICTAHLSFMMIFLIRAVTGRQCLFPVADNPLGPFTNEKQLLHPFSIDSHVVKTRVDCLFSIQPIPLKATESEHILL